MRYVIVKKAKEHCPPSKKHDKKILIKHHEKDLAEAVKDKDQNYAKRTVKDIEEISEGKHAAEKVALKVRPGLRDPRGLKLVKKMFTRRNNENVSSAVSAVAREKAMGEKGAPRLVGGMRDVFNYSGRKLDQVERIEKRLAGRKQAEQLADELDMIESVDPQFLREAPLPVVVLPPLPYLSPKLAYDQDGIRIPITADPGETMLKLAAKAPGPSVTMKGFSEGYMVFPAPSGLSNAAQAAAKATGEMAHVPTRSWGEAFSSAGKNLLNIPRVALSGEGKLTGAQKLQGTLAVGLIGAGALGIRALLKRRQVQAQYDAVLAQVMDDPNHQNLTAKETKVPEAYAFLRRYAPTLALDPTLARTFVRTAVQNEDLLHATLAQALSDAESKHLDARRPRGGLKEMISHPIISAFSGKGGGGGDKDK